MNFTIGWAGVGVIIAILVHAFLMVRWSAKLETTVTLKFDQLTKAFSQIDKELEKRDAQIRALWTRVDNHGERLSSVEGKCRAQHGTE